MDDLHSTLGYGVLRSSKNLGELASDDYPAFGTLIWREKLTSLTLLLLTGSETVLFGVGSLGSIYIILPQNKVKNFAKKNSSPKQKEETLHSKFHTRSSTTVPIYPYLDQNQDIKCKQIPNPTIRDSHPEKYRGDGS
ncbi:hypothetical protein GmHk_04G010371 [Glycine max]|uniref:Uncharacterized protein n=1 Tax=Glycine max TaxID=3847 RepID=A0A0R0KEU5_SOYBN|nr:hypothetical protein JHK86_009921 [Glycine max]KAH1111145.1 hypothetical protein GYH30_009773 [Glycine max]KAH1253796.1 hypothetical protein GmHk_04G010371 [Glycine max]